MTKCGSDRNVSLQSNSRTRAVGCLLSLLFLTIVLAAPVQAQTLSTLYAFTGSKDGGYPGGVIRDSAGNIYGTSGEYGSTETVNCTMLCGNVFQLPPDGKVTSLHTFNGGMKGYLPGNVVGDQSGNFYGTVAYGGPKGAGFVFKLSKSGALSILHSFPATSKDGQIPGNIFLDSEGNIYGLTSTGGSGSGCPSYGCGIVFKLDKEGKETIFNLSVAAWAPSGLTRDAAGNLYGTTILGGVGCGGLGCGTLFKIDKTGKLTVLYKFQGAPDGAIPEGSLALDKAGNVYGTTWEGGDSSACVPSGCGTIYKFSTKRKETILHKFSVADGFLPESGLILDSSGNLFGTTFAGGTASNCQPGGCGTVFKFDKTGHETVLYSFTNGADGANPIASLVLDSTGNLYGSTTYGGYTKGTLCFPVGCGTVFKLTP